MPPKKYLGKKGVAKKAALRRAQAAVNKKGYNKVTKKKMMRMRQPFVETKSKTHEDLAVQFPSLINRSDWYTYDTEHAHLNPETFFLWHRGMEENEVIGNSCYAKYLKMKINIRFPQPSQGTSAGAKQIPMMPQNYELIWGWIPNELNFTNTTTPKADEVTHEEINQFINHRVVDYFNEQKDKLRFIPKRASTLRITGRRKVRPDMRRLNTAPPQTIDATVGADYAIGTIPDFFTSISWRMNKKLHLQPSTKLVGGDEGLYPNFGTWLPFATLVNWDYESLPGGSETKTLCPSIQYNDCIWYSDS
jgi:hypothetical protein